MLDLLDGRWADLAGGYKLPYDPRPVLQQLRADPDAQAPWDALWDELHHQGDLGEASYAAVPVLVDIFGTTARSWQFHALIALIELERNRKTNPNVPDWIEPSYKEAWAIARRYALADLATANDAILVQYALSVVALGAGHVKLGAVISSLDASELDEFLDDRLAWSELYDVAG